MRWKLCSFELFELIGGQAKAMIYEMEYFFNLAYWELIWGEYLRKYHFTLWNDVMLYSGACNNVAFCGGTLFNGETMWDSQQKVVVHEVWNEEENKEGNKVLDLIQSGVEPIQLIRNSNHAYWNWSRRGLWRGIRSMDVGTDLAITWGEGIRSHTRLEWIWTSQIKQKYHQTNQSNLANQHTINKVKLQYYISHWFFFYLFVYYSSSSTIRLNWFCIS